MVLRTQVALSNPRRYGGTGRAQSRPSYPVAIWLEMAESVTEAGLDYTAFFRDAFPGVLRTIELMLRDRARAEEITQDAFVQLYLNWAKVSRYERPDAWVRRVAIRLMMRSLRRAVASRPRRPPAVGTGSTKSLRPCRSHPPALRRPARGDRPALLRGSTRRRGGDDHGLFRVDRSRSAPSRPKAARTTPWRGRRWRLNVGCARSFARTPQESMPTSNGTWVPSKRGRGGGTTSRSPGCWSRPPSSPWRFSSGLESHALIQEVVLPRAQRRRRHRLCRRLLDLQRIPKSPEPTLSPIRPIRWWRGTGWAAHGRSGCNPMGWS